MNKNRILTEIDQAIKDYTIVKNSTLLKLIANFEFQVGRIVATQENSIAEEALSLLRAEGKTISQLAKASQIPQPDLSSFFAGKNDSEPKERRSSTKVLK